ncbi:MAG: RNase P subunit p30 family protein [Candidatus Pacearchaeota archaeon]
MNKYTIINETEFLKARDKIKKAQKEGKFIIFSSRDDELNRKVLEKERIDVLLLSLSKRKDFQKQRNSGFNQVMAKLAQKKKIIIGIDIDEIIKAEKKEKIEILARIRQNIKICKKNKIRMIFFSEKYQNEYNLKSLGLVLGMPTWMTKNLILKNEEQSKDRDLEILLTIKFF